MPAAQFQILENLRLRQAGSDGNLEQRLYFPAIIITDHNWVFVAATKDLQTNRITFYSEERFGNTRTMLGIYQLVVTLQRIARWIKEELPAMYTRGFNGQLSNLTRPRFKLSKCDSIEVSNYPSALRSLLKWSRISHYRLWSKGNLGI